MDGQTMWLLTIRCPTVVKRTDTERLDLFVERVNEIFQRRGLVESTVRADFKLELIGGGQTEMSVDVGDVEDLRSLVLDFRHFMAPKEDVNVRDIIALIEGATTEPAWRAEFRDLGRAWEAAMAGAGQVVVNAKSYTGKESFNLVVNGWLFHSDKAKRVELDQLPDGAKSLIRGQFNTFVLHAVKVLGGISRAIVEARRIGVLKV